jgi:signal transduction histidine kinase
VPGLALGYVAAFVLWHEPLGPSAAALSGLWLVAAGWVGGRRAGLLAALANLALNYVLHGLLRPEGWDLARHPWPLAVLGPVLGVASGLAGELVAQVRAQTAELREERQALQAANAELARANAELAAARDAALASTRAKGELLAFLSHELRTPLTTILGYAELVLEQPTQVELVRTGLQAVQVAGRHLHRLSTDLLELSRLEAGKLVLEPEHFPLAPLLTQTLESVRPLALAQGNALRLEGAEEAGWLHADVTRVRQVLLNLLGNACKFTRGGVVVLRVERTGAGGQGRLALHVEDSGPGLAPEQVARLFQDYAQLEGAAARGGAGLGLSISRRLARLMGGDVEVHSRPGEGSTFSLVLPAPAAQLERVPSPLPPTPTPAPRAAAA